MLIITTPKIIQARYNSFVRECKHTPMSIDDRCFCRMSCLRSIVLCLCLFFLLLLLLLLFGRGFFRSRWVVVVLFDISVSDMAHSLELSVMITMLLLLLLLLLSLLLFYDIWKNGKRTKATVTDLFQS